MVFSVVLTPRSNPKGRLDSDKCLPRHLSERAFIFDERLEPLISCTLRRVSKAVLKEQEVKYLIHSIDTTITYYIILVSEPAFGPFPSYPEH